MNRTDWLFFYSSYHNAEDKGESKRIHRRITFRQSKVVKKQLGLSTVETTSSYLDVMKTACYSPVHITWGNGLERLHEPLENKTSRHICTHHAITTENWRTDTSVTLHLISGDLDIQDMIQICCTFAWQTRWAVRETIPCLQHWTLSEQSHHRTQLWQSIENACKDFHWLLVKGSVSTSRRGARRHVSLIRGRPEALTSIPNSRIITFYSDSRCVPQEDAKKTIHCVDHCQK